MNRIVALLITLLSLLTTCSSNKQERTILFEHFTMPSEMHPEWPALFTKKHAITPLETTPDALIGPIDKIKKLKGHYYISSSSGQSILHFNKEGKFVAALNKLGQGPEEYHRIEDFDVYEIDGQTEVWISDNHSLKVYDAFDFSFKYKIPYSFMIHKFKRLANSHILLVTGQRENILTLTDKEGNVLSEYLKKEIPFIMFRSVQFVAHGSEYLYQLGISNTYVAFDPQTETFRKGQYSTEQSYLSEKQLLELFNTFGTDFIREANQGAYINNLLSLGDITWIHTHSSGKNYLTKVDAAGSAISTEFSFGTVLSTISAGDSDDSILLYITPDQLLEYGEEVVDKFGNTIACKMEDNPYLLEFF